MPVRCEKVSTRMSCTMTKNKVHQRSDFCKRECLQKTFRTVVTECDALSTGIPTSAQTIVETEQQPTN